MCSQVYFGQKAEEHCFPSKNIVWRLKTTIFEKNVYLTKNMFFSEPVPLFKGPGRAHMGTYGPLWAHMDPKNPKKYVKKLPY